MKPLVGLDNLTNPLFLKIFFLQRLQYKYLGFMFEALEKIGMAIKFITMAKLFKNVEVSMHVNSGIAMLFNIERGVR
jgi:hypothetical protein